MDKVTSIMIMITNYSGNAKTIANKSNNGIQNPAGGEGENIEP